MAQLNMFNVIKLAEDLIENKYEFSKLEYSSMNTIKEHKDDKDFWNAVYNESKVVIEKN